MDQYKRRIKNLLILLLFVSIICIIIGSAISFTGGCYWRIGSNIGIAGYIVFGFVIICLCNFNEICEMLKISGGQNGKVSNRSL